MLVPFRPDALVHLAIVALGDSERLRDCVATLVAHESRHDFTLSCVSNPLGWPARADAEESRDDTGIRILHPASNLGWAGGLHLARRELGGRYLVCVQEDMLVRPGWLDALVEAAEAEPELGAVGSTAVDERGEVDGYAGGWATPADDVDAWNLTDQIRIGIPATTTRYDWITSKGMLVRLSAWDAVGGADPRLFPLNHVDKDLCTHLRAHGFPVAVAPGARLLHEGATSAPNVFRRFLGAWQHPWFADRWSDAVRAMEGADARVVPHPCAEWGSGLDDVERAAGEMARAQLVPFARFAAANDDEQAMLRMAELARAEHDAQDARMDRDRQIAALQRSTSWRLTAPIRALSRVLRHHED